MKPLKRLKWFVERGLHLGGYCCSDTEHLLYEYVEGDLDQTIRQKLDKHLADCPSCIRYMDGYRKTIELTHQHGLPQTEIPPELKQRLQDFIQQNPDLH